MWRETKGPSGERPCRVSAIPSERHLFGIISELRRLNRSIASPLERELKRAGCPPLERCEVLREIDESGDGHLSPVELQTRLAIPRDRMSRLIDRLAKDGYIERERVVPDRREHFVVITDLGRRASKHASSVLSAALRQFFYSKETRMNSEAHNKALVIEAFDTLFNKRDYAGAERFWSPTYIQHSAHISPGREGLFGLIKSLPATLKYEHGLIITVRLEVRWPAGSIDRMRTFAKELVALQPDVFLASTTPVTAALRQDTSTIPIVFVLVSDPVGGGFVAGLRRPNGNMTGFTNIEGAAFGGKWLEMLKAIAASISASLRTREAIGSTAVIGQRLQMGPGKMHRHQARCRG